MAMARADSYRGFRALVNVECHPNGDNAEKKTGIFLGGRVDHSLEKNSRGNYYIDCTCKQCKGLPCIENPNGSVFTASAFEKHAGREKSRKWRLSVKAVPATTNAGTPLCTTIGKWLHRQALILEKEVPPGTEIRVWSPDNADGGIWRRGKVLGYDEDQKERGTDPQRFAIVKFDDGPKEKIILSAERLQIKTKAPPSPPGQAATLPLAKPPSPWASPSLPARPHAQQACVHHAQQAPAQHAQQTAPQMPLLQLAQQALLHTAARPPLRITSTPHGPAPSEAAAVNIPASREQVGPAPGGGSGDRGRERPALTAHAYGGGGGGGANDSAPENLDDAPTQAGHHGRADREDGAEEKSDADSAGDTGGSGEDGNEEDGAGDEDDPRTEVVDEEEGEEGEVEDDSSDEESPDEDLSTVPRDSPGGRIPVVKQEDGDIHTPRHQRITPSNECPGAPTTTGHRSARPPEFTLEHRVAISPLQGRRLSVVDLSRPNGVPLRAARVPARANDQQPPRPSMRPPVAPSVLPCIARNPSAVPAGAERALGGPSGIVNPRRSSINEITVLDEDRRARAPERQPYMERSRDIYRVRQLRRGSTLRDTIHQLHGIPATERRDMSPSLPDSNGLLVLQPPRAPVNGDPRVVPPPVPGQRPPEGTPSQRNSPSGIPSPGRGRLRPHPDRVREDARWIRMVRARGNGSTGGPQVSAAGQPHGSAAVQAGPSDALPGAVRQGGPDLGAVRQRADRAVAGAKDTVTKLKAELQEAKRDAQRRGVYADNLTTELNAETQKRLAAEAKVADLQRTVAALQQVVARQQRSEVEFMAAFEQMCANLQELTGTQVSQDGDGDVMVEEDEDEA